ncbi:MAG: hypothetical protein GF387_01475 [Candidatus Portnoybacteria bacterium]|nr:hypothetical protein [Candidatus Portnoybacteria bacterium]
MKKLIEKIQKKPRSFRVMVLWIAVIVTMIIILSIWLILSFSEEAEKDNRHKEDIPSLFETLKGN